MDSWEWNKYAAAILSALVFVLAVHFAADAVFSVPAPVHPAYVPSAPPPVAAEPAKPAPAQPADKGSPAK